MLGRDSFKFSTLNKSVLYVLAKKKLQTKELLLLSVKTLQIGE